MFLVTEMPSVGTRGTTVSTMSTSPATPVCRPQHVVRGSDAVTRGPVMPLDRAARPGPGRLGRSARLRTGRVPGGDEGFTLVELLVVVGVLVTLVGIAIPAFSAQQERAWDAAVRAQLRAGTIALASYHAQNAAYDAEALDPSQGWGYEASPEVVAHWSGFSAESFCGRAWRRTEVDTVEDDLAAVAGERAQFAATPEGVFAVDASWTCP